MKKVKAEAATRYIIINYSEEDVYPIVLEPGQVLNLPDSIQTEEVADEVQLEQNIVQKKGQDFFDSVTGKGPSKSLDNKGLSEEAKNSKNQNK